MAGQTDTAATQREREGERETAAKRCQVTPPLTPSPRGRRSDCRGQQQGVCNIFTHCSCIRNIFHRSSTVQVFCHCQHSGMAWIGKLDFPARSAERGDARFEYQCDCPAKSYGNKKHVSTRSKRLQEYCIVRKMELGNFLLSDTLSWSVPLSDEIPSPPSIIAC